MDESAADKAAAAPRHGKSYVMPMDVGGVKGTKEASADAAKLHWGTGQKQQTVPIYLGDRKKVKPPQTLLRSLIDHNPLVWAGMGATVLALAGGLRAMLVGSRLSQQKFMQYRVSAQFFTIAAMCVGMAAGSFLDAADKEAERRQQPQ